MVLKQVPLCGEEPFETEYCKDLKCKDMNKCKRYNQLRDWEIETGYKIKFCKEKCNPAQP